MLSSNLMWGWLACVRRGPKKPLSPAKIPGKSGVEISGTDRWVHGSNAWRSAHQTPSSQDRVDHRKRVFLLRGRMAAEWDMRLTTWRRGTLSRCLVSVPFRFNVTALSKRKDIAHNTVPKSKPSLERAENTSLTFRYTSYSPNFLLPGNKLDIPDSVDRTETSSHSTVLSGHMDRASPSRPSICFQNRIGSEAPPNVRCLLRRCVEGAHPTGHPDGES